MIERHIKSVLEDGIAALVENKKLIVELFVEQHELDVEEATQIANFFVEAPPTVVLGYARGDTSFPCYSVVLADENESQDFIGYQLDHDEERGIDNVGALFDHVYSIIVYAQNPDAALYYYEVLKYLMILAVVRSFQNLNLMNVKFSGAELAPDQTTMPAGLYLRRFTMRASREYNLPDLLSRVGRAWKIRGVHVNSETNPRDVLEVNPKVTASVEDDE